MISISYAILACNEYDELKSLIDLLAVKINTCDEIVVVLDSNCSEEVHDYIYTFALENVDKYYSINFSYHIRNLDKDFSSQKNFLNSKCKAQYIFNIDADEIPNVGLLGSNLTSLLEMNELVDVYKVPRINIVKGVTDEFIKLNHWITSSAEDIENEYGLDNIIIHRCYCTPEPIINFPDWQFRIYKNDSSIHWVGKVHEILTGYKTQAYLPTTLEYSLLHIKEFNKQIQQNNLYATL